MTSGKSWMVRLCHEVCLNQAGHFYNQPLHHAVRATAHDYLLIWVLSGKGVVRSEGQEHQARAGDLYVLLKGHSHEYFSDRKDPWEILWVHFDGALAPALALELRGQGQWRRHLAGRAPELTALWHGLIREAFHGAGGLLGAGMLLHLLGLILDHLRRGPSGEEADRRRELARRLLDHIQENLGKPVTLDEMAQVCGLSRAQFVRVFRSWFGCSPVEFLIRQRIAKASLLLSQTRLTVKEVAAQAGYQDEFYFSRLFKKRTGRSPAHYRHRPAKAK